MSAIERRAEIMRILTSRRKCYLSELSDELGVSKRTIQRDIQALVLEYPLESISGNGGGIRLADWYYPHKNILSQEHIHVIEAMIEKTGSYLTIEERKDGIVPVAVWEVTADDEKRLDAYEGYPNFYYKKNMKITLAETGKKINAFVYIMHEERRLGIPSQTYINTCRFGYAVFGFDYKYLDEAYEKSVRGVK